MVVHSDRLEGEMAKVSLTATLEHGEAKLDYLKVAWRNFLNGLPTLGFNVESEYVAEGVEIQLGQFWSGTTAEAAITSGLLEPDANEPPKTLKDVKAGIKALKSGIGGNRVLSQQEMADALGVSRHQIRKALGKR